MATTDQDKTRQNVRKAASKAVRDALRDHGSASPEYARAMEWLESTKRKR